jgi:D-alanyl-D-alanine carboxypeptidase
LDLQKLINAALPILPFSQTDHADAYSFNAIGSNPTSYSIKATSFLSDSNSEIGVLKTGFTDDAKQAMVAESSIQGQKIISIVLESNNRDADTAALINYVGTAYLWPKN